MMKKTLIIPATLSLAMLIGCTPAPSNPASQVEEVVDPAQEEAIANRNALTELLYLKKGVEVAYDGYAEYGHTLTLTRTEEKANGDLVYHYEGRMNDGLGDDDGTRVFEINYVVTPEGIREEIINHDPQSRLGDESLLNSIIPNQLILATPLEDGATWEQFFNYQDGIQLAVSTLSLQTSETGATQYVVTTTVEGLDDYLNGTYREVRTYEAGLGLVSFQNIDPLTSFDEAYQAEYTEEEFYQFGYGRTGEVLNLNE